LHIIFIINTLIIIVIIHPTDEVKCVQPDSKRLRGC